MTTRPLSPLTMLLSRHTRRRDFITFIGGAGSKRPVKLVTAAILCFAGVYAEAAEIHDGDTGYIAKNSIWFTDESDLSVWKRVRQTFAPKDVKTYQQIILEERQAWQFSGPIKVKVISYWANQHEIHWRTASGGSRIRTIPTQRGDRVYPFYAALHECVIGTKRTCQHLCALSALRGKADRAQVCY